MGHGLHKSLNKGHFLLVDNLEEFNSYPWGKLSYKATISSLIKASKHKHVSNAKHTLGKMVYNLYGFPHVFQIKVLSPLHPTQEELKECYMTGLLSEGEDSGVRGHESDSGIKELNGEAEANAQWEANHYSIPTNSSSFIGCTNSTTTSNNCSRKQKKKQKSNSQLLKVCNIIISIFSQFHFISFSLSCFFFFLHFLSVCRRLIRKLAPTPMNI